MPSYSSRSSSSPAVIDCSHPRASQPRGDGDVYIDGVRDSGPCTHVEALRRVSDLERGFIWLHLHEPPVDELICLAEALDLHHLDVKAALHAQHRPRSGRYDGGLVLVVKTLAYLTDDVAPTSDRLAAGQVTVFVGGDFVLSVGHGEHTDVTDVRGEVGRSPGARALRPDEVLRAIVEHVVYGYLDVSRLVEAELDAIEQAVFSPAATADIEFLYRVRRDLIHMRRAVGPLTPALRRIAEGSADDVVSADVRHRLKAVIRHNVDVTERLDNYVDALAELLESAYGLEATQQNVDMRKISAWAALAAIPTTVSGIYGMRFVNIPGTHWAWGYPAVIAAMALVTFGLHRAFRRKGWL